jgi:hypothetical protein
MSVKTTVLFDRPQRELARLLVERMETADSLSIVTGFATPGGIDAICEPIRRRASILEVMVVGAATYAGFEALDELLSIGVKPESLCVYLGHTAATGGRKNPFARFHPMLHSKIYYMEKGDAACAFVGSHNVTAFALGGLNGEAAVLLEGPIGAEEFVSIRQHIKEARSQGISYTPSMKTAYAWWVREFMDGVKAEIGIPTDWSTARTILIFVASSGHLRPKIGEHLYFEIPAGIEQIESLKTEVHMFLFDSLPASPTAALNSTEKAAAKYVCTTLGAENRQGNLEVAANWQVERVPTPMLRSVPSGRLRPGTPSGMQQVRAEVASHTVLPWDYLFERESTAWDPVFEEQSETTLASKTLDGKARIEANARDGGWRLVRGLKARGGVTMERDAAALKLATPESGSFIPGVASEAQA